MKPRLLALICLFNLTLLGVGFFWLRVYFNDRPAQDRPAAGQLADNSPTQAAAAAAERARPASADLQNQPDSMVQA